MIARSQQTGMSAVGKAAIHKFSKLGHKSGTWNVTLVNVISYKLLIKMMFMVCQNKKQIGLKATCLIYQVFINQSLTVFVCLYCARKRQ